MAKTGKMTIADALKYSAFLSDRLETLKRKVHQFEATKLTTRIVSQATAQVVQEQTEFTMNPVELMAEYDKTAKELRLTKQAIEKANHTIEINMEASY